MGVTGTAAVGVLLAASVCAQTDTTYIRTFSEKITVRTSLLNTSNSFVYKQSQSDLELALAPNKKEYLGISFLFRSVELDVGFAPKFLSINQDNEGARLFTLNFRMFLGRWMQTLDVYQQRGFTATSHGESIALPSLATLKLGGSTSYIFNDRFSFRAIGFQNEWQRRSAGSFIPQLTTYYTHYDFPDTIQEGNVQSFDLAVGPGYFYNWVPQENIILSGGATAGIGFNTTQSNGSPVTSMLYESTLRAVAGYNSERFFAGVNTNYVFLEHNDSRTTRVEDHVTFIEFYIGYRFNAPRKMMNWAKRFNETFHLK